MFTTQVSCQLLFFTTHSSTSIFKRWFNLSFWLRATANENFLICISHGNRLKLIEKNGSRIQRVIWVWLVLLMHGYWWICYPPQFFYLSMFSIRSTNLNFFHHDCIIKQGLKNDEHCKSDKLFPWNCFIPLKVILMYLQSTCCHKKKFQTADSIVQNFLPLW